MYVYVFINHDPSIIDRLSARAERPTKPARLLHSSKKRKKKEKTAPLRVPSAAYNLQFYLDVVVAH